MKVPTKHGLDRKFKPWRKGKSSNSNKRSSLKQQLRGHERLLAKILKTAEQNPKENLKDHKGDDHKTEELTKKIAVLKQEISQKQQSMVEKKNAENSHGQRFLDRQRLTRQEKKVRKSASKDQENQLLKIALDQVYVAHHPNDVKYMPLFKHGKRVTDQSRQLFRRAVTRKRILRDINTTSKLNWIRTDQYERLPKDEWTIQDEERIFGGSVSRSTKDNTKSLSKAEDSRFAMATNHETLLKAAEQAETNLLEDEQKFVDNVVIVENAESNKEHTKNDSSSSSSSDSSSDSEDEEVDPLSSKTSKKSGSKDGRPLSSAKETNTQQKRQDDHSSSDTDSASSTSDDSDRENVNTKPSSSTAKNTKQKNKNDSSSSDSDSSSDSSDSDSCDTADDKKSSYKGNPQTLTTTPMEEVAEEEEIDDFLIDATDNHDVFNKPALRVPALSTVRGDKSKGFETQSQRPGEYKKKRIRRL